MTGRGSSVMCIMSIPAGWVGLLHGTAFPLQVKHPPSALPGSAHPVLMAGPNKGRPQSSPVQTVTYFKRQLEQAGPVANAPRVHTQGCVERDAPPPVPRIRSVGLIPPPPLRWQLCTVICFDVVWRSLAHVTPAQLTFSFKKLRRCLMYKYRMTMWRFYSARKLTRESVKSGFKSIWGSGVYIFYQGQHLKKKCWNKIARLDTKLVNVLQDKKPPNL